MQEIWLLIVCQQVWDLTLGNLSKLIKVSTQGEFKRSRRVAEEAKARERTIPTILEIMPVGQFSLLLICRE